MASIPPLLVLSLQTLYSTLPETFYINIYLILLSYVSPYYNFTLRLSTQTVKSSETFYFILVYRNEIHLY